jgi:hypothetical protein
MTQDQAFRVVDLVIAQSNDLWPLSLALIAATFLIWVKLIGDPDPYAWRAARILEISMVADVVSISAGYLMKGSLVAFLDQPHATNDWKLTSAVEWLSLIQLLAMVFAVLTFLIAFVLFRTAMVEAAAKAWGK